MTRWLLLGLLLLPGPAGARTLSVGPQQPFPLPSAAARAAQDGDTVLIEPGEYYDCAVLTQKLWQPIARARKRLFERLAVSRPYDDREFLRVQKLEPGLVEQFKALGHTKLLHSKLRILSRFGIRYFVLYA